MSTLKHVSVIAAILIFGMAKGQNKWGFETMVNTMISNKVDTISANELLEMQRMESVLLLDSREYEEYKVSHLERAKHIGYDSPDYDVLNDVDKTKPVVVYCSIGKRSEDIGLELKQRGFTNVYNLYGGIFDWTNRGFPVMDMEGNSVKKVHPFNTAWGIWVNNYEKVYGTE
ncbi:MAG: rhodanese-like domain-containing protein [Cryomorphaceae bacterium]